MPMKSGSQSSSFLEAMRKASDERFPFQPRVDPSNHLGALRYDVVPADRRAISMPDLEDAIEKHCERDGAVSPGSSAYEVVPNTFYVIKASPQLIAKHDDARKKMMRAAATKRLPESDTRDEVVCQFASRAYAAVHGVAYHLAYVPVTSSEAETFGIRGFQDATGLINRDLFGLPGDWTMCFATRAAAVAWARTQLPVKSGAETGLCVIAVALAVGQLRVRVDEAFATANATGCDTIVDHWPSSDTAGAIFSISRFHAVPLACYDIAPQTASASKGPVGSDLLAFLPAAGTGPVLPSPTESMYAPLTRGQSRDSMAAQQQGLLSAKPSPAESSAAGISRGASRDNVSAGPNPPQVSSATTSGRSKLPFLQDRPFMIDVKALSPAAAKGFEQAPDEALVPIGERELLCATIRNTISSRTAGRARPPMRRPTTPFFPFAVVVDSVEVVKLPTAACDEFQLKLEEMRRTTDVESPATTSLEAQAVRSYSGPVWQRRPPSSPADVAYMYLRDIPCPPKPNESQLVPMIAKARGAISVTPHVEVALGRVAENDVARLILCAVALGPVETHGAARLGTASDNETAVSAAWLAEQTNGTFERVNSAAEANALELFVPSPDQVLPIAVVVARNAKT